MAAKATNLAAPSITVQSRGGSLVGDEKLKRLYAAMLRSRALERRARLLSKQGFVAPYGLGRRGQEAAEVGCAIDLRESDDIASADRDFVLKFIKGVPLKAAVSRPAANSFDADETTVSPVSSKKIVGKVSRPALNASGPFGVGASLALAKRIQKKDGVVVAFSSDDSRSVRRWDEALALAGAQSLPILFVVQCLGQERSARLKGQKKDDGLISEAQRHGFPGIPVDGNDVVAVYRVAYESLARARRGGGPTLIECKRYHCDNRTENGRREKSRPKDGTLGQKDDPIRYMEEYLLSKGLFTEVWKEQLVDEFTRELDVAFETANGNHI
jgi:TPP-dependent pyruvate/acetoin dehydrogenase alpha subunit